MTTVTSSYVPVWRFADNNNNPLVGGKVYTYYAGTTTPAATYTDATGSTPLTNPIILNARGETANASGASCSVWFSTTIAYKIVVQDSSGNLIWTVDNYTIPSQAYSAAYADTFTATAGQTVFTLTGTVGSQSALDVSLDGATLVNGVDFTWTSPSTLTLTVGAKAGQILLVKYLIAQAMGTMVAGGTSGQILYNNGGSVQGFTMSGDVTVVPTTGVATVNAPSSHITYTQGGTGATSRTVTSKLQESVSVLDFGADPTGSTDSTSAIQAAMTAGSGGEVIVPYGTYKISTGPITVPSGTSVRFLGSAKFMHYGSGDCLSLQSVKDVTLNRPYVDLTNAGASANGIAIRGAWYVNFYAPRVLGGNSGQSGIYIETSASAGANYGAYMIEIHNPDLGNNNGSGVLGYGIQTAQTVSDTVQITMLNVYGGWGKNCTYGLYYRGIAGFKVYGWTHDTGTDAINIASSSDGVLMPGELGPCTGYGINWGSGCSAMNLMVPNLVGVAPTSGYQNNTTYTPQQITQGFMRSYISRSDQTYYWELKGIYSYGSSFQMNLRGGGNAQTVMSFGDAVGLTVNGGAALTFQRNAINKAQFASVTGTEYFQPTTDLGVTFGASTNRWTASYTGIIQLSTAAASGGTGTVTLGATTATIVGAAGGASALPATPLGYLIAYVGTTQVKIPYYNA